MKVLITGGAGYIGYSLVKQLLSELDNVHSITIYDNLSRKNFSIFTEAHFDNKPINFIRGDILDGRSLSHALKGIDCVVHLAAKVTTPYADHDAHIYDQVNHWGTAQLSSAVEQSDVSKVIYVSSMSVYGNSNSTVNEQSETNPHSFYGISKLAGEKQLQTIVNERDIFILRSGNVYGYNPAYRIDAVVNRFMFNAHFLNKVNINGNGEQGRSFIHVDKIARLITGAIDGLYVPGLYNAVEHNLTVNNVVEAIREFYPNLESTNVSFNVIMKSLITELPCKVFSDMPMIPQSLHNELKYFKDQFSF